MKKKKLVKGTVLMMVQGPGPGLHISQKMHNCLESMNTAPLQLTPSLVKGTQLIV
jgi:hypothetical protein